MYGVVWEQVYNMLRQLALPESRAFTAYTEDDTVVSMVRPATSPTASGTYTSFEHPDRRLHWLPIAVDGTSRHEASYVHCTLGGTASPDQLSSCWLLWGSEKWETLYAASQAIDFDDELHKVAIVSSKDTGGNDRQSFFFSL